jgi:regulator of replication initiation timing
MGWGRTLLLGDIGNRLDIGDCEESVRTMQRQLHKVRQERDGQKDVLKELADENAELKLYMASLIRLLISKDVITTEEFARFVNIIDAEDGRVDGKLSGDMKV